MDPVAIIGWSAVALLVAGWLFVTFGPAGPRRRAVAWMSASALYVALLSLFVRLVQGAHESGSTVALVAFGFLVAFFSVGLLVAVWKTVGELRGGDGSGPSATG